MQESTNREKILKKVRSALIQKSKKPNEDVSFEGSFYKEPEEIAELIFAQRFSEAGGNFIFCENKLEFAESLLRLSSQKKWKIFLCEDKYISGFLNEIEFPHENARSKKKTDVCINTCECLVARTGSIVVSSAGNGFNNAVAKVQLVYATTSQLMNDYGEAIAFLKTKYNNTLPSSVLFLTAANKNDFSEHSDGAKKQKQEELFLFLVDEAVDPEIKNEQ